MRSMTREEIYTMVQSIDLPCAYYEFPEDTKQAPPFVVWFFSADSDVMADNENYVDKEDLNVELYTITRDFDLEKTVENVLRSSGFAFSKEAAFIESERMWQISYEMEVIING